MFFHILKRKLLKRKHCLLPGIVLNIESVQQTSCGKKKMIPQTIVKLPLRLNQMKQISPPGTSEVTDEPDSSNTSIAPPQVINVIPTPVCGEDIPQGTKSPEGHEEYKNQAEEKSKHQFWLSRTSEVTNESGPSCEYEKHRSSSVSNTSIAPPRVINIIPPPVLEDVPQAIISPKEDLQEDRDQPPYEACEPSSQFANEQGMGLPKHLVAVIPELSPPLSGTTPDRDTMIGNMVSVSVQTDDGETPDRDNMRGSMVTVAVQTDDGDYDSHTFGIAPTTATIFVSEETGELQSKMDYTAYQREPCSILQELNYVCSRQTPSRVDKKEADETEADETEVNKIKVDQTSTWFHDGVFSHEFLKELQDIGQGRQPPGMASSSLKLLIDTLSAQANTSPPTAKPAVEIINENPDENSQHEELIPPIFRKGSFDISPHDPPNNDNFNTVSEPLKEVNQLPSQLHARRERLRQQMIEQRRRAKNQRLALLKKNLQRAAKSIKKGLCSAAQKCVLCRTKHKIN